MARALLIVALVGLGACSIDLSLVGKACSADGLCPDGLVCAADDTCQTEAGTPTTTTAADWTPAMTALYRFEPGQLPIDASGAGRDLIETDFPGGSNDAIEGSGALSVDKDSGLESADSSFAFPGSFTVGAWLRTSDASESSPNPIQRRDMNDGYAIERLSDSATVSCNMRGGGQIRSALAPDAWPLGEWVHVICRYLLDGTDVRIEVYVDGAVVPDSGNGLFGQSGSMPLRVGGDGFVGDIDELLFIGAELSSSAIARIHACGVDGQLCTCAPDDPAAYSTCGRAMACDALPPCNQASP